MAVVQITFRDLSPSPAVTAHIERRVAKLATFFDRMVKCHVVVKEPHKHLGPARGFALHVDMHVPGKELVVATNDGSTYMDVHAAVDDIFRDAERVLEEHARSHGGGDRSRAQQARARPPHGVVAKVFRDRGYGFIVAEPDGHEVYFHKNSIVDLRFDRVAVGVRVRFNEEDGDKGPQASTVHVRGR